MNIIILVELDILYLKTLRKHLLLFAIGYLYWCSVSSNQITLPAGTYYIDGSAPNYRTGYSHVYLYNVTDSANEIYGYTDYANPTDGAARSHVVGRFTISSQKVFELRNYAHTVFATYGLGLFMNYNSLPSTYAEVLIWRTA